MTNYELKKLVVCACVEFFLNIFFFIFPCWWNDMPNSIRAAETLAIFKEMDKNIYLSSILDPLTLAFYILSTCFIFIYKTINTK